MAYDDTVQLYIDKNVPERTGKRSVMKNVNGCIFWIRHFFLIHYIGFGSTKDNNDDLPHQSLALPDLIARIEHITIYKSCC